jgi:hypothetical protein
VEYYLKLSGDHWYRGNSRGFSSGENFFIK